METESLLTRCTEIFVSLHGMRLSKSSLNAIFFLCGVLAVVVMLVSFDVSFVELWHHLCRAGYWLVPIVGIWVFVYGFNAWAWQTMIRSVMTPCSIHDTVPHSHPSFLRIYRLTVTGYALNYATPVGGLGGEPYRIMELSGDIGKEHATSSVILYAMMHFLAHFFLWFTSVFLYLVLGLAGDLPIDAVVATVLGAIILFCLVAFYVLSRGYRNGVVQKLVGWVGKVPGLKGWSRRFAERHRDTLHTIDEEIASLYQRDSRAFWKSFWLEYASRIVQSGEIFFMLLLFDVDCGGGFAGLSMTFLHSILILSFTTLFANIIGFLPMQLGVQEGGFVLSIAALGLSAALGVFVSIICRVREIIWIAIGMLLMVKR